VTWIIHKQSFINGLLWACNYVFLLLANPKTPSLYQVVFNELNLVVVFILSLTFQGNGYTIPQFFALIALFVGGLLPLVDATSDGGSSVGWYLMYIVGAWSIGVANLVTENVMRNVYFQDKAETPKRFLVSISQFLFLTNLYSIAIVLALLWVPYLAYGADKWQDYTWNGMKCIWTGVCKAEDNAECEHDNYTIGVVHTWLSSTLSFICAYLAAYMQREKDVVYVSVAYAVAPVLSVTLFVIHPLMGNYYEVPDNISITSCVITLVAGVGYKALTLYREKLGLEDKGFFGFAFKCPCFFKWWKYQPYNQQQVDLHTTLINTGTGGEDDHWSPMG